MRKGTPLVPQQCGGGQEFGLRGGTENVAGAAGLAAAMKIACRDLDSNARRMETLRERLRAGLGDTRVNGHPDRHAPHILNVSFEGVESDALILSLDAEGICVSAGSACASMGHVPSHVLQAMGLSARGSVRFSLSSLTTEAEIDAALAAVRRVLKRVAR